MRPIKFRALLKDKCSQITWWEYYQPLSDPTWDDNFGPYKIIIKDLQFTGLLDKTGKEIYEGDIVEHYGEVFIVEYEKGAFIIKGVSTRIEPDGTEYTIRDDLLMNQNDVVVIIGNTCENQELLEAK